MKLCFAGHGHCFRARVVVLAAKFPAFGHFSKYDFINLHPQVIVTDDQYKFMMEDYMQTKLGEDYVVPKRYLNVRVRENATDLEMLTLAAGLRAAI